MTRPKSHPKPHHWLLPSGQAAIFIQVNQEL
jgi:hypothetical protein